MSFTNSSLNEYKYLTTLKELINNKTQLQNEFA